jgi:hypothetical protein
MSGVAPVEQVASTDGKDANAGTAQLDFIESDGATTFTTNRILEAPPAVRAMTADERKRKEQIMLRKIDFRLLPPIIIMYIMNYLDR